MELDREGLMDFPRKHPDCTHCGTVLSAMTVWSQNIHDTCPCICHSNKTTQARQEQADNKKRRKRK